MLANTLTQVSGTTATGYYILSAWNVKETAGATAVVQLKDDTGGNIKKEMNLAANESIEMEYAHPLRAVAGGAGWQFVVVSGSVKGSVSGSTDAGR